MVAFPPCKINLGLHVVGKRPDGYHNLETCFYPVPWTDMLEIIPSSKSAFTFSGLTLEGKEEDNLCAKAYALIKSDHSIPPVLLHLHKVIPSGAGLGGGSSDAAATLKLLNELFALELSLEQLTTYAARLGSDVPFFIHAKPLLGTGKGEILTPVSVTLSGKFVLIVVPHIHSSTAEAYRALMVAPPAKMLREVLAQPATWRTSLTNDFERLIFAKYPVLETIRQKLYASGAWFAGMSGSGSAVFGLFDHPVEPGDQFEGMMYWTGMLS